MGDTIQPTRLAEMYSYVIACAYHDLKHQYLFSILSDPGSSTNMENVNNLNVKFIDLENAEKAIKDETYHELCIFDFCQGLLARSNSE